MKTPTPLTKLGFSRGVQRRIRRSLPAIRAAYSFGDIVDEAMLRQWGDRLERSEQELEAVAAMTGGDTLSIRVLFQCIGRQIEEVGEALVTQDEALADVRRQRRQACRRRDLAQKRLFKERAAFRKMARGFLGPKHLHLVANLEGETARDAWHLAHQATVDLLWTSDTKIPPPGIGLDLTWPALVAPLVPLTRELQVALAAAVDLGQDVDLALSLRNRARADFDREYNRGARVMERFLAVLGLPSLAAAVRPHLKVSARVGRPSKQPEVDLYPDLVERARLAGLLPEQPEESAAKTSTISTTVANDEIEPLPDGPKATQNKPTVLVLWTTKARVWWRRLRAA